MSFASGAKHPKWKGGRTIDSDGYVKILMPDHPRANGGRYVREHILVAENALGKPLPEGAQVHHVNGKGDNKILVICQDNGYHMLLERRTRAYNACGHAGWLKCGYCGLYDDPKNMYVRPNGLSGYHSDCKKSYDSKKAGT
jgi:hypothetical protein